MELINREMSWLAFNHRVLQEADDERNPLIERMKFLGIFSNNLDEFMSVRVASLKRLKDLGLKTRDTELNDPEKLMQSIEKEIQRQQNDFERIFLNLKLALKKNKYSILQNDEITEEVRPVLDKYFDNKVIQTLVPIFLTQKVNLKNLKNGSLYFLIDLDNNGQRAAALIEKPKSLSRFYHFKNQEEEEFLVFLDDIIRLNADKIFQSTGFDARSVYSLKLNRDSELELDTDAKFIDLAHMRSALKERPRGNPVSMIYDSMIPDELLDIVLPRIGLGKGESIIPGGVYHNRKDLMNLPKPKNKELRFKKNEPLDLFKEERSVLDAIKKSDALLTFPYNNFNEFIRMVGEAAIDPNVKAIKMTVYRLAEHSLLVHALKGAHLNGKKVVVYIELKARFDEAANMEWVRDLESAGIEVKYGIAKWKIHAKLLLIEKEVQGKTEFYSAVGTGNMNEDTSEVYSDFMLLTKDKQIGKEVNHIFDSLVGKKPLKKQVFENLLVSPYWQRDAFVNLIHQEINNQKIGKPSGIKVKLNSLQDDLLIEALYLASEAGVKVELIIRGICCLKAGIKPFSENIETRSIVGRYLEHGRMMIFENGGDKKVFIGSADWMIRNMKRRLEVSVEIKSNHLKNQLDSFFDLQWSDNQKSRDLSHFPDNVKIQVLPGEPKINAQEESFSWMKKINR